MTVPYVTRIFNPTLMGSYNYTSSITTYFTMFGMLGIITYGSNQIAKVSHRGKQEISKLLFSINFDYDSNVTLYNLYICIPRTVSTIFCSSNIFFDCNYV